MTGFQVSFSVSPRPPRSTSPSYRGLFAAPSSFLRSRKLRKFRGLTASLTYTETGSNGLRAWHAVRVLPGPPRSPMRTAVFRSLPNSPQFAGADRAEIAFRALEDQNAEVRRCTTGNATCDENPQPSPQDGISIAAQRLCS